MQNAVQHRLRCDFSSLLRTEVSQGGGSWIRQSASLVQCCCSHVATSPPSPPPHTHTHARTHARTHTHAHTHAHIHIYIYIHGNGLRL